jgi:hypothetical protein
LYGWGLVNAARAAVPCTGDLDTDRDVDGTDMWEFIAGGSFGNITAFAASFGRTACW